MELDPELRLRLLSPATKTREAWPSWALWPAGAPRRRGCLTPSWSSRPSGVRSPRSTRARILAEADACTAPGAVGELLRREGLYTSHLTYWRKKRKDGALQELGKPRGRKPADTRDAQIVALTRRAERAEADLVKMKRVVEIQGNVSALLEEMLGTESAHRSTER